MRGDDPAASNGSRVGELTDILSGFAFKSEHFTSDPGLGMQLIRIRDLKSSETACRFIGEFDPAYVIKKGDIIVGMDGEFLAVRWGGEDALLNQRVLRLKSSRPAELDEEYLFFRMQPELARLELAITGTTVKHLSTKDIKRLCWELPPLDEQRRIAEVLRSADEAILAAENVSTHYGAVIQKEADSVIRRLLADEAIEGVRLGDIARVKGGKRLPKGSNYEEVPTGNPYIRVTDWEDYSIQPDSVRWISNEVAKFIMRYTISSNDLFISIAGSIGLVASVPPVLEGAYLTENAAKIVVSDTNAVDVGYLLVALRSETLAEQIRQQKGVGGGVPKLALFRIEDLMLPLPPIEVQREITASYLSLKSARERSTSALLAAKKLRADLADDLLPGRIRVPA